MWWNIGYMNIRCGKSGISTAELSLIKGVYCLVHMLVWSCIALSVHSVYERTSGLLQTEFLSCLGSNPVHHTRGSLLLIPNHFPATVHNLSYITKYDNDMANVAEVITCIISGIHWFCIAITLWVMSIDECLQFSLNIYSKRYQVAENDAPWVIISYYSVGSHKLSYFLLHKRRKILPLSDRTFTIYSL